MKRHLPTFAYEREGRRLGYRDILGVDEAGRGPLAGPVVAAAVRYRSASFVVPRGHEHAFRHIRDSKMLSEHQRERAFQWIEEHFDVGVGIVDALTIDRVNILQATFLAMRRATEGVCERYASAQDKSAKKTLLILVDGNREVPGLSVSQKTIVKGDSLSILIAAASIVAKVTRDRMMCEYDREYPGYGFARHKGYGTAAHLLALRRLGPCPIHRRSCAPVACLSA